MHSHGRYPGKDDSTSGPLAWLLAGPVVLLALALPTVIVSTSLFVFFVALDSVLGLPRVTIGVLRVAGVPADWVLSVFLAAEMGTIVGVGLVARNGFDWEGIEADGGVLGNGPFP